MTDSNSNRPQRWDLRDDERQQVLLAQRNWSLRDAVATLARAPRLAPEALRLALQAAKKSVWNDVELGVLLDSERVRQALPGTQRGAHWSPDRDFIAVLQPRLTSSHRVLEVGCGVGRLARQVAPRVGELVCTDVSRVMLRESRENLATEVSNVSYQQTSGYWLTGLPTASFDVVYAHAVFYFFDLYPALAMLDEIRRVLCEGGVCVLSFLTIDRPAWAADAVAFARRSASRQAFASRQFRPYAAEQLDAFYAAVGLRIVERRYADSGAVDDHAPLIITAEARDI